MSTKEEEEEEVTVTMTATMTETNAETVDMKDKDAFINDMQRSSKGMLNVDGHDEVDAVHGALREHVRRRPVNEVDDALKWNDGNVKPYFDASAVGLVIMLWLFHLV